jgi:hypothetical protein
MSNRPGIDIILGIDVHPGIQYKIDWGFLFEAGIKYAYIKKAEHLFFTAPNWLMQLNNAMAAGVKSTVYDFHRIIDPWRPWLGVLDPGSLVDYFLKDVPETDWEVVWDIEDKKPIIGGKVTGRQYGDHVLSCLHETKRKREKPKVYTGDHVMRLIPADLYPDFAEFDLLVASYPYPDDLDFSHPPTMPQAWDDYLLHQFSTKFKHPAIKSRWGTEIICDMNKTTPEKFARLLGEEVDEPNAPMVDFENAYYKAREATANLSRVFYEAEGGE